MSDQSKFQLMLRSGHRMPALGFGTYAPKDVSTDNITLCIHYIHHYIHDFSFFLSLLVRSYMSITPGSANLEILIK